MGSRTSGTRRGNGAGQGPGWGGGAKGAGSTAVIAPTFDVGNTAASVPFRDMSSVEAALLYKQKLHELVMNSDNEAVKMNAAIHLLNRIEGMPVARNLNIEATGSHMVVSDRPMTADEWTRQYAGQTDGE